MVLYRKETNVFQCRTNTINKVFFSVFREEIIKVHNRNFTINHGIPLNRLQIIFTAFS